MPFWANQFRGGAMRADQGQAETPAVREPPKPFSDVGAGQTSPLEPPIVFHRTLWAAFVHLGTLGLALALGGAFTLLWVCGEVDAFVGCGMVLLATTLFTQFRLLFPTRIIYHAWGLEARISLLTLRFPWNQVTGVAPCHPTVPWYIGWYRKWGWYFLYTGRRFPWAIGLLKDGLQNHDLLLALLEDRLQDRFHP